MQAVFHHGIFGVRDLGRTPRLISATFGGVFFGLEFVIRKRRNNENVTSSDHRSPRPTTQWYLPQAVILDFGPSFGVVTNQFGFIIYCSFFFQRQTKTVCRGNGHEN